ncbi:unnamed protein product, partial [Didymodactylos carnosus]
TENHNIFKHFSSKEYRLVLDDIRHCILATDLVLFFENRTKLNRLLDDHVFDWNNSEHIKNVQSLTMTATDLCATYKSWTNQQNIVSTIMDEFWEEGDEEKRQGLEPLPLMNRSLAYELPKNQVNFIGGICIPCYELLERVLPDSSPMLAGARSNLQRWQELADQQRRNSRTSSSPIDVATAETTTSTTEYTSSASSSDPARYPS